MKHLSFGMRSKKILNIALPAGLNSLLDISNVVIGVFIISTLSSFHIVAVGLSMNFIMLQFIITNIFYVGTNAQISRFFGRRDFESISRTLSSMLFGALLTSIPIFFLADYFYSAYFVWIGADETSIKLGEIFVSIIIFGIPCMLAKSIIISSFTACGNTKTPFFIKIFVTTLNLALNYILIFGVFCESLDIVGMALANLITSHLELIILLFLLARKNARFTLLPYFSLDILKKGIKIGAPTGLERTFTIISLIFISKFVASYGSDYLAGFQIGARIEAFVFTPSFGFVVASMVLSGQYLGQNRKDLVKSYIHATIILASLFMCVSGAIMIFFGEALSAIFSPKPDIIHSSAMYLFCVGLSQIPLVFTFVLDGAYRGAGATKISLAINSISIWALRVIPMYLCVLFDAPLIAIYIIILVETTIRGAVFFGVFKKYFDKIFVPDNKK